ncbi:MAG: hypothetical protein PWP70_648, partial [Moorella sp. (in: firmicutes)]|nr:hypothetical protein [Moorella sp. (in: firmicutes)]
GMEKGMEKGELDTIRANIKKVLKLRFGPLPSEVTSELERETAKQKLDYLLERAVLAASMEEFKSALFSA